MTLILMTSEQPGAIAVGVLILILAGWVALSSGWLSRIAEADPVTKVLALALIVPGLIMIGFVLSIAAVGLIAVVIAVLIAGQN